MINPSIDLIQVFCANFKCDIDLRLPPGLPRYINTVKWPDLDNCKSFNGLEPYDKKIKIHDLVMCLKKSRYSIETFHLVLSNPTPLIHLQDAIKNHYMKTPIKINFYAEKMILVLDDLGLLPNDIDRKLSIREAEAKFNKWLQTAFEKCS
jgi:hypothetical protein